MKLIVGLGNPGEKYKGTRHNIGFMMLDYLAEKNNWSWQTNKKLKSDIVKDGDVIYVKPLTYMNNSGESVRLIMSYYKLIQKKYNLFTLKNLDLTECLTVIHDEIDIDLGNFKHSPNSRSAGHRGVESIINNLKTKNFHRVRVGVKGDKPNQMPLEKYVLAKFSNEELKTVENLKQKISQEI